MLSSQCLQSVPSTNDLTRQRGASTDSRRSVVAKAGRGIAGLAVAAVLMSLGCDRQAEQTAGVDADPTADSAADGTMPEPGTQQVPSAASGSQPGAGSTAAADASPPELGIGDPAPELEIGKFVTGSPVDRQLPGDKVYVVEFWATWCAPCRVSMPHLSSLQEEYGDQVAFVGVTREDAETVQQFLDQEAPDGRPWREVIQYRLATDADGGTSRAYMQAAGQGGIPTAFIVGRSNKIEWIGHPGRIDEPLRKVVEGSWDRDAAVAAHEQQTQETAARERLQQLDSEISKLARAEKWDQVLDVLDQVEGEIGSSVRLIRTRILVLERAGRGEQASKLRTELVEQSWEEASTLNNIAWTVAKRGPEDDLDLAMRAAKRASELNDGTDASSLDTVARVHYELGNLDEAIRWQRKAVEHGAGRGQYKETLDQYLEEKQAAEKPETDAKSADGDDAESGDQDSAAEKKNAESDEPAENEAAGEGGENAAGGETEAAGGDGSDEGSPDEPASAEASGKGGDSKVNDGAASAEQSGNDSSAEATPEDSASADEEKSS